MRYKTTTLDKFVTLQRGYDLPAHDRIKGDIPIIAANGPVGFHNVSKVDTQCVVIGRSGSVGNPQLITEPFWPLNTTLFVKDFHGNLPTFVYYVLKTIDFQSFDAGGTVPTLNRNHLTQIEVPLLDLAHQESIGGVLQNLDSKISANNALSKTLENIAQTIFKSWFIDFEPVKAKMAGAKPIGMNAATASLFPDSMEESEHGAIPKSWSWITVGDIAAVIDCLHAKKPELHNEGYPYLQLDTISDSGVLRFENAGLISKEDYDKWTSRIEVQGGDCLITNVGRVGAVSQVPEHFKAAIGRNITAMRPKDSLLHGSFLIVSLLSDFMKKEIKRNTDSGTILEALNVKNIPKLIIPGPSDAVLLEFARLCDPLQLQIQELHAMNVNLKKIRDSLLPRLISGELKIPDEMLTQ
jgi:type I restriction enzyme S subunit